MGGWASRIEVSPGRNEAVFPFGRTVGTRLAAHDTWVKSRDADYDIGCIHLDEALGDQTGWFGVAALPPAKLQGYLLNIAGYPADRGAGKQMFFHHNRVLHISPRRIFNEVDTYGGQSGAPAWVYQEGNPQPLVVGVHAYGTGGTPADLEIVANSAPLIDASILDLIRSWIEVDTPK